MVTKYKWKFKELLEFAPYIIYDESTRKKRFLNKLDEEITLCILGATHPSY